MIAREFVARVDDEIEILPQDPDGGRPHRLCHRLVRIVLDRPFVCALRTGDANRLGVLAQHPRSVELLGPAAVMYTVLPVWWQHRLARTDWPLDEQAYALQSLMTGFLDAATRPQVPGGVAVDDPDKVIAAAVTALLGPEEATCLLL